MNEPEPITDYSRPECAIGQDALQRLLDGDINADTSEASTHRLSCLACRDEWAIASIFPTMPAPDAPIALGERLWIAARADRRRRRVLRSAGAGLALAASLLLVAFLPRSSQSIDERTGQVTMIAKAEPNKPLGESFTEARDALIGLTKRVPSEVGDQSAKLMPNPQIPEVSDRGEGLEPLADARNGASKSVTPVTNSARRAFNLFLRAADPPDRRVQP